MNSYPHKHQIIQAKPGLINDTGQLIPNDFQAG